MAVLLLVLTVVNAFQPVAQHGLEVLTQTGHFVIRFGSDFRRGPEPFLTLFYGTQQIPEQSFALTGLAGVYVSHL